MVFPSIGVFLLQERDRSWNLSSFNRLVSSFQRVGLKWFPSVLLIPVAQYCPDVFRLLFKCWECMNGRGATQCPQNFGFFLKFFLFIQCLQMMCWWAENPDGDEFKNHLARVPDFLWLSEDGMKILSVPYMDNGATKQFNQIHDNVKDAKGHKQDLRSLGLCLVRVSSMFPVSTEINKYSGHQVFWAPSTRD